MATRLYFPETEPAPVTPPAPTADWDHVNAVSREALTAPDTSALTTTNYTPDASDHLVNGDALHRQYVTAPLADQTVEGTVTAQLQCLEAHANNNLFLTMKIYVISFDGVTTKEALLPITRATSLEVATALTNRTFPSTALTLATLERGDRLCIEVGLAGTPAATSGVQGHNGSLRFGCSAAGGDLAVNETDTGTTVRPWIEFSANLAFDLPALGVVGASGAFAPLGGW